MNENVTLEQAAANMRDALEAYNTAHLEYMEARTKEVDALYAVNAAQKTVDGIMSAMRKDAPDNSDWKNNVGAKPERTHSRVS